MSKIAYLDEERRQRADNDHIFQHLDEYRQEGSTCYCPNPNCIARLHPFVRNNRLFWRSSPSTPHSEDCVYGSNTLERFDPDEYDYRNLNINDILAGFENLATNPALRHGMGNLEFPQNGHYNRKPGTLREIYLLLKNLVPATWLQGRQVRNVLIDSRSIAYHIENTICGRHIGELQFVWYEINSDPKRIDTKVLGSGDFRVTVSLLFPNDDIFFRIKKKIYAGGTHRNKVLIVSGNWKRSEVDPLHYDIHIHNERQIYVLNVRH